jgi:hypothetical protein
MLTDVKRIVLSARTAADALGAIALMVALFAGLHLPLFV